MRCDFPLQIALEMCVMCDQPQLNDFRVREQIGASPNARVPSDPGSVAPVESIKPSYFWSLSGNQPSRNSLNSTTRQFRSCFDLQGTWMLGTCESATYVHLQKAGDVS